MRAAKYENQNSRCLDRVPPATEVVIEPNLLSECQAKPFPQTRRNGL
jgi:hypothetical protein